MPTIDWDSGGRYALILALMFFASTLLSVRFFGSFDAVVVTILILAGLALVVLILQPWKQESTAAVAIKHIATLATTYPTWAPASTGLAKSLPAPAAPFAEAAPLLVFAIASAVILTIALIWGRPPLAPAKSAPNTPFQERTYRDRFARVAGVLRQRLDNLDDQTNWTDQSFEPLDAEVEEITRTGRKPRKIGDLLTAIKQDRKSRIFLVIGEPGSGKSTSLRKLCKDLLKSAPRTGIMPLYINLKEWRGSIKPAGELPTSEDLFAFIEAYVQSVNDVFVSKFFDAHLRSMIDHGRIFFILDSFDEIPTLLDQDETSELIYHISSLVGSLVAGATEARGVVASRMYRRPRGIAKEYKHLEVRPFSETKIRRALLRDADLTRPMVDTFMRGPPRWISAARNPFVASLVAEHLTRTSGQLPQSQIELYENYTSARFALFAKAMTASGLSVDGIKDAASEIAHFMFSSSGFGLEANASTLRKAGFSFDLDAVVTILVSAKIAREGPPPERAFSFVHRRFNEYFLVRYLRQHAEIDLTAIEQDRRERDALVLYAETADEAQRHRIVEHCWNFINAAWPQNGAPDQQKVLQATYCLRFLIDAFSRTGSAAISRIEGRLHNLLSHHIDASHDDPLRAKISVEASGLFDDERSAKLIWTALFVGEPWVAETAIRSCRYIGTSNEALAQGAANFIISASDESIRRLGRDFGAVFESAESLRPLRSLFMIRRLHTEVLRPLALLVATLLAPLLATMAVLAWLWEQMPIQQLDNEASPSVRRGRITSPSTLYTVYFVMAPLVVFYVVAAIAPTPMQFQVISPALTALGIVPHPIWLAWTVALLLLVSQKFSVPSTLARAIGEMLSEFFRFLSRPAALLTVRFWIQAARALRTILPTFLGWVALGGVWWGITYIETHYANWLDDVLRWIAILTMIAGVVYLIGQWFIETAKQIKAWNHDRELLRALNVKLLTSRDEVATAFAKLKSASGRIDLVTALALRSKQDGWKPEGEWPGGSLPAIGVTASSELARLEEQWRGLDR